jgi:site-specific recombinase XerD
MATVNFHYRSRKPKSPLTVRLFYRTDDKRFMFETKIKLEVTKAYWTTSHGNSRSRDIDIVNYRNTVVSELGQIESHILDSFKNARLADIDNNWLEECVQLYYNPNHIENVPHNLVDYVDYYIDYRKRELKPSSFKKFRVIQSKMRRLEVYRRKPIMISEINDAFKKELIDYYRLENYSQNTLQRDLVFIKTFCKHARFKGVKTHNELDSLRVERGKAEKIYLSFDELEKIEKLDETELSNSLLNARDWLLISCYTGQRVSDFLRFTPEMIRTENSKPLIEFTQVKTGKNMTVPLHHKVLAILAKRGGAFPYPISDQKYNDYIKLIAKKANLSTPTAGKKLQNVSTDCSKYRRVHGKFEKWELISSHIGRRSFATNFYGLIPTSYLIYVTGHSTEEMFLEYIGKSNKDMALELTKYF